MPMVEIWQGSGQLLRLFAKPLCKFVYSCTRWRFPQPIRAFAENRDDVLRLEVKKRMQSGTRVKARGREAQARLNVSLTPTARGTQGGLRTRLLMQVMAF